MLVWGNGGVRLLSGVHVSGPQSLRSIAERRFQIHSTGGDLIARLAAPEQREAGEWACPIELEGPDGSAHLEAFGEDSLQALQLGLVMLSAEVLSRQRRTSLRWLGGEDLGLTFDL